MGLHFVHLISYSITSPLLFDCIVCNSHPAQGWHARTEVAALWKSSSAAPAARLVPPRSYPASSGPTVTRCRRAPSLLLP